MVWLNTGQEVERGIDVLNTEWNIHLLIEIVFRDFLQAKDFAHEVNAHTPSTPLDVPMGEFVDAAIAIAVVIDHDVLGNCVDTFNDRRSTKQKAQFSSIELIDSVLLQRPRESANKYPTNKK